MIAGWAALGGWFVSELLRIRINPDAATLLVVTTAGTVGGAIALGLNVLAGLANAQWRQLARRALPGLAGGGIGGIVGGLIGQVLYVNGLPREIGWLIVGVGIGVVEGLYEQSQRKIRNGLIGGAVGGLLGGLLFDPIVRLTVTESGMSGRAIAFVVLGLCIGASIGLAQVVLRDAWLTVMDGYRTGRQLTLTQPATVLGRAEHVPLPFLGPVNKEVGLEHLTIFRCPDGSYALEDNHSKLGTRLNNRPVEGRVPLANGDVIKLGTNLVRFNERRRRRADEPLPVSPAASPWSEGIAAGQVGGSPPAPPPAKPSTQYTVPSAGLPRTPPAPPTPAIPSPPVAATASPPILPPPPAVPQPPAKPWLSSRASGKPLPPDTILPPPPPPRGP